MKKERKPFKERKIGKILTSKPVKAVADIALGFLVPPLKIGAGAVVAATAGVTESIKQEKRANLESSIGGVGRVNSFRVIGYLTLVLFALYAIGVIPEEVLDKGIELINEFFSESGE